jgi:hypothetical protein
MITSKYPIEKIGLRNESSFTYSTPGERRTESGLLASPFEVGFPRSASKGSAAKLIFGALVGVDIPLAQEYEMVNAKKSEAFDHFCVLA